MRRTTVTLDADVEQLIRDAMQRSRQSFKETLNGAIRRGLSLDRQQKADPPFVVHSHETGGMRPGIDSLRLNQLADELEVEAFVASTAQRLAADKSPTRHRRK